VMYHWLRVSVCGPWSLRAESVGSNIGGGLVRDSIVAVKLDTLNWLALVLITGFGPGMVEWNKCVVLLGSLKSSVSALTVTL